MTKTITFRGHDLKVTLPYGAGHVCTSAEAQALNSAFLIRLKADFKADFMKKHLADNPAIPGILGDEHAIREEFASFAQSYKLMLRNDPISSVARKIAEDLVSEAMRKQGLTSSKIAPADLEARIKYFANTTHVQAEARRRVEAVQQTIGEALEE
jgi:hypothetical protein